MGTLKPQSNGPLTAIRWLVHSPLVGGLLHLVQRGRTWAGCGPAQSPLAAPKGKGIWHTQLLGRSAATADTGHFAVW